MGESPSPFLQRLMNQKTLLGIITGAVVVIAVLVFLLLFQQGVLLRTQVSPPAGGGTTGGSAGGLGEQVALLESTDVDGPPNCDGCAETDVAFTPASVGQCPDPAATGAACGVEDFPAKRTEPNGTIRVTAATPWTVHLHDWDASSMEEAQRDGSQLPQGVCGIADTQQGCTIVAANMPAVRYAAHILCQAADPVTEVRSCAYVDKARGEAGVLVDVQKAYLVGSADGDPLPIKTSIEIHARYPTDESVSRIEGGSPEAHRGFVGRLLQEWAALVLGHEKNHVKVFAGAMGEMAKNFQDPVPHLPESFTVQAGEDPATVGDALARASVLAQHQRILKNHAEAQIAVEGDRSRPREEWRRTDVLAGQKITGNTRTSYVWYWYDAPGVPGGEASPDDFKNQGYVIVGP